MFAPPAVMNNNNLLAPLAHTQYKIESVVYYPMRNFNPMPMRPYLFSVKPEASDRLAERMAEAKAGSVTPGMLNGIASGIMGTSAVAYAGVINSSWVQQPKYLFMMKVSHVDYLGTQINSYFFGYTEHDGMSFLSGSATIDTTMLHCVNNVIETTTTMISTPMGVVRSEKLLRFYNAVYNQQGYGNATVYTQRPTDLYNAVQATELANVMTQYGDQHDFTAQNVQSIVSPFAQHAVVSTTENGIASEYLARVLTGSIVATKSREIHVNSYQVETDQSTIGQFTEPNIAQTEFLRVLSRISGNNVTRPMFTMGDLMRIDPTIYDRFQVYQLTSDFSNPILTNTPEVGEAWMGQDIVTTRAYNLLENCVALATKYGFQDLSFMANNMVSAAGESVFQILNFNSFLSLAAQEFNYLLEVFKDKFFSEIFINETQSGQISINMECHVNLFGGSKIFLQLGGYPGVWYTAPTFASSLYSQVVTPDKGTLDAAAHAVASVVNTLMDSQPRYAF
ncbi:MAG: hypothetical protein PHN51_10245 [Candidatus Nanopelagicales bacterium]|nr:hypothetical protein [Candidatus Nanopelagicales bacterium]